jgi:hypothetical protein
VLAALGLAGSLGAVALAAPASARPEATVTLDRTEAKVGDTVTVELAGFPAGNLYIEVCGNEGLRGSADCDLTTAITSFATPEGTGRALFKIGEPPIGCPCVVRVSDLSQSVVVGTPITLTGVKVLSAAERPASARLERKLEVTSATLTGSGPWTSQLGAAGQRTLVLTLHNTGGAPLTNPGLSIAVGRGSSANTVVDTPDLGTLKPGEEQTYSIPVTLELPAFGKYTVEGEILGLDEVVTFSATTTTYPWGLGGLLALVIGLFVTWRIQRRKRRKRGAPEVAEAEVPAPRVIDLTQA